MASAFKRKRKVTQANGKAVIKQSQKCYTRLTDADGIERTIPLYELSTLLEAKSNTFKEPIEPYELPH